MWKTLSRILLAFVGEKRNSENLPDSQTFRAEVIHHFSTATLTLGVNRQSRRGSAFLGVEDCFTNTFHTLHHHPLQHYIKSISLKGILGRKEREKHDVLGSKSDGAKNSPGSELSLIPILDFTNIGIRIVKYRY